MSVDITASWTHLDLGIRLQAEPLGNGADIHISTLPLLLPRDYRRVLTGSGALPWPGCASCGKSFGKARGAVEVQSASHALSGHHGGHSKQNSDIPSFLKSYAGRRRLVEKGGKLRLATGQALYSSD